MWLVVHLAYLTGFKNRFAAVANWTVAFLGRGRRQRTITKQQVFDYGDKHGVAIEAIYGIEKMQFGSGTADRDDLKDHGIVTGYFASSTVA